MYGTCATNCRRLATRSACSPLPIIACGGPTTWSHFARSRYAWIAAPCTCLSAALRRIQSTLQLPYLHFFESMRFASACWQELAGCDLLYERMGWMGCGGAIAARRSGQPLVLEVNGDHLAEYEMLGVAPQGIQRTGFAPVHALGNGAGGLGGCHRRRLAAPFSAALAG